MAYVDGSMCIVSFLVFFSDLPDFYCRGIVGCSPGVQFSACEVPSIRHKFQQVFLEAVDKAPRNWRADWSKIAVTKMTMGLDYEKGDHTVLQR